MSFGFASIEHALASIANDIVKGAKLLTGVATKVQGSETAVEAVSAAIDPQAVPIERAAYTALGLLTKAAGDVEAGAASLTISATQAVIGDFKALYAYLTSHPLAAGTPAAAAPTAAPAAPSTS